MTAEPFDYLLVGGGLQNAMIALAVWAKRPGARICLVERGAEVGGNHLWCFHAADLGPEGEALVAPLVARRWPSYAVRFPSFERSLESAYAAVRSEQLARVVRSAFAEQRGSELRLGQSVASVSERGAVLESGEEVSARLVIDARGPDAHGREHVLGYQKFVGLELELARPTELAEPIVMDATVKQEDGFRFVYTLPLSPTRVLVEDTYFSDTAELNRAALNERALAYAHGLGLDVSRIFREETGVLPLTAAAHAPRAASPLRAGYAGGFFHPTTGYSFPIAMRLALHIAARAPEAVFDEAFAALVREHARQQRYACLLNRLLFQAVPSEARRNVLERFYRLPEASIARFYALETTALDRARILCGRPPRGISLTRAFTKGLLA